MGGAASILAGRAQVLLSTRALAVRHYQGVIDGEFEGIARANAGLTELDERTKIAGASVGSLALFIVSLVLVQLVLNPLLTKSPQLGTSSELLFAVTGSKPRLTPELVVLGAMQNQLASHHLEGAWGCLG